MPRLANIAIFGASCIAVVAVLMLGLSFIERSERIATAVAERADESNRMFRLLHVPPLKDGETARFVLSRAFGGASSYTIRNGQAPTIQVERFETSGLSGRKLTSCTSDLPTDAVTQVRSAIEKSGVLEASRADYPVMEDGEWVGVQLKLGAKTFEYGNNSPSDPVFRLVPFILELCPASCTGVCRAIVHS